MVDLEPLHLRRDLFPRGQKRRHRDQRAQRLGNPVAQLQARQRDRVDEKRRASVDERHASVNRGNRPETSDADRANQRRDPCRP